MSRTYTVTLEGERFGPVKADHDEPMLQALERAGLRPMSGCRYGACRTCAAELVSGHVSMPPGTALTADQLAQGYFLPCVAHARSDCTVRLARGTPKLPVLPWTD